MSISAEPRPNGQLVVGAVRCTTCNKKGHIDLPSPGMNVSISYFYNSAIKTVGEFGFRRTLTTNIQFLLSDDGKTAKLIGEMGFAKKYRSNGAEGFVAGNSERSSISLDQKRGKWILLDSAGTKTAFPIVAPGLVAKVAYVEDSVGNRHTYEYGNNGSLKNITDAVGRSITFSYDGNNLLDAITDWGGRTTKFEYDVLSNPARPVLTKVIGPTGCKTLYSYDPNGRLTSVVDPNGYKTDYAYDSDDRVSSMSAKQAGTTHYSYDFSRRRAAQQFDRITTDSMGNTTTETFGNSGRLLRRMSASGVVTVVERDSNGLNPVTMVGGIRKSAQLHDKRGNVIASIDAAGLKTLYAYDAHNNVTMVTSPDGSKFQYIWGAPESDFDTTGARRRLQKAILPTGSKVAYTYDQMGHVLTETASAGASTTHTYDAVGNRILTILPTGGVLQMKYDAAGNLTEETDAAGNLTRREYDARGRKTSETNALGNVTRWAYDGNGNNVAFVDALGNRWDRKFSLWDQPETTTSPLGGVTRQEFDKLGHVVANVDALGNRSSQEYDADGRQVSATDELGNKTIYSYKNGISVPVVYTDPLGNWTETLYDEFGRKVGSIDSVGHRTSVKYDELGRISSEVDALGGKTITTYDGVGLRVAVTDPIGNKRAFTFNADFLKTSEADELGNVTSFEYDSAGNRTNVVDAIGNRTIHKFDASGRLVSVTDASGQVTQYHYDEAGNQTVKANPDGHTIESKYDAVGREISRLSSTGERYDFSFDPDGNRITETNASGTIRHAYDAAGRLSRTVLPDGKSINFTRDSAGKMIEMIDHNGGKTTFKYDAIGRQTLVTNPLGETTKFEYNDADGSSVVHKANGIVCTKKTDSLGRETSRTEVSVDGTPIASYISTYDAIGNRLRVSELGGSTTVYQYDAKRQLIGEVRNGDAHSWTLAYEYDKAGNRVTKSENGELTRYHYGACNELLTEIPNTGELTTYSYDAGGRLNSISKAGQVIQHKWNANGHLAETVRENGVTESNVYNANGIRISKAVGNAMSNFIVAGQNIIAETGGNGEPVASWTHTNLQWGGLIAEHRNGSTCTFGFDPSSNTRQLTDSVGRVVLNVVYDAFGVERENTAPAITTPHLFGGEYGYWTDTRNTVYIRARHYSPLTGRWELRDPIGFEGNDWNLYRYTSNAPTTNIDPSGLICNSAGNGTCHDQATNAYLLTMVFCAYTKNAYCASIATVALELADCECDKVNGCTPYGGSPCDLKFTGKACHKGPGKFGTGK